MSTIRFILYTSCSKPARQSKAPLGQVRAAASPELRLHFKQPDPGAPAAVLRLLMLLRLRKLHNGPDHKMGSF